MEKKKFLFVSALCALMAMPFVSCSDDDDPKPEIPGEQETTGVYILNAGKMNSNNATLDYYNPETKDLTTKVFSSINGCGLGDTANDMLIYGSKMYIAVSTSASIEVTDFAGKSLKKISPKDDAGVPQQPRMLTTYNGKVYVTLFDGHLACIDTTSMDITQKVKVGPNPEGVCELNGKLYVANSGGYNEVPDSTLSVVDAASFTVTSEVKVNANPKTIQKDSEGHLYVLSLGDYHIMENNTLQRLTVSGDNVTSSVIESNSQIVSTICNDMVYIYSAKQENWVVTGYEFKVYDAKKDKMEEKGFITDGTVVDKTYCMSSDPVTNNVYIGTSDYTNTGDMYIFTSEGKLINKLVLSGLNPMGAYFITAE